MDSVLTIHDFIQGDMDEMSSELGLSEDKAKKAMVDAARLADELRQEQELAQTFEKDRKLLECQAKDCQARLDDAEQNALKVSKHHFEMGAIFKQLS